MAELSRAVFENDNGGRVEMILHQRNKHFYLQSITDDQRGSQRREERHLVESAESRAKAAFAKAVEEMRSKGFTCVEEASA